MTAKDRIDYLLDGYRELWDPPEPGRRPLIGDVIPDRYLAILTFFVIGFVLDQRDWAGYAIGCIVGGLVVYIFFSTEAPEPIEEVHPAVIRAWIRGAHRAHGGDSFFPIENCTEPECENGVPILDAYRDRKESRA